VDQFLHQLVVSVSLFAMRKSLKFDFEFHNVDGRLTHLVTRVHCKCSLKR